MRVYLVERGRTILPLLGVRAGVRSDILQSAFRCFALARQRASPHSFHVRIKLGQVGARPRSPETEAVEHPIVIAIDGTSASGKSTNAKLVAKALGYVYVDTGAMYRTLAWYCLKKNVDVNDHKAVASLCRRWKSELRCVEGELRHVRLLVDGYYPEKEVRTSETSAAVSHVAAVPKVRDWMKKAQRQCIQFGNLVMEGRDIGTNIFPETDYKFYLDANLDERTKRRQAEGVTRISPPVTSATASAPPRR